MAERKQVLDVRMPSRHPYLMPLALIGSLLASYLLVSDWQAVPGIVSAAWAAL